jgi:mannosyltransferase OCH1-like enzyme
MLIHQILFLNPTAQDQFKKISENKDQFETIFPLGEYHLWNLDTFQEFLKENFPKNLQQTFQKLIPYAYKADFARYALLYIYGGWYFDFTVKVNRNYSPNHKMVLFRDIASNSPGKNAIQNSVIYTRETFHKLFEECLYNIERNIKDGFYGKNPLYPTGPVLFGENVERFTENYEVDFGQLKINTHTNIPEIQYMIQKDIHFATHKTLSGGELNIEGSNNYNALWNSRHIYQV